VISGEGIIGFNTDSLKKMKSHLSRFFESIRIVVYVRDPQSWASSKAQQLVKRGKTSLATMCDPDAIAARRSPIVPLYRVRLEPFLDLFGRSSVDIRVYDRSRLMGGDVISDFCAAIGEPGLESDLIVSVENTSLSYEAVLLADVCGAYLATSGEHEYLATPGREGLRSGLEIFRNRLMHLKGTRFVLPQETLNQVREATADDVAWLRTIMGEDVFTEEYRPAVSTSGPDWSRTTLLDLVALVDNLLSDKKGGQSHRKDHASRSPRGRTEGRA
jgi:hypothetical protein